MTALLTLFILLETAHCLAPILLGWSRADMRRLMKLPVAIFCIGMAGGLLMPMMMKELYLIWNFWHFAMQNFGIFQLVRGAPFINMPLAFVLTTLGFYFAPLATSVNHWIMDIGLSTRASGQLWFLIGLFALTPIAFMWDRAPWLWPQLDRIVLVDRLSLVNNVLIAFRLSLGFYHFDVSRWIWKQPQVRGALSKEFA